MENLSREYLLLFNAVTDTEQALERLRQQLILTQQRSEELYISKAD